MTSQTDLDQGGTARQWVITNMGPTVGNVRVPLQNVFPITTGGTYILDPSTTYVPVNSNTPVTITLPSALDPAYQGGQTTQPGLMANSAITIVDVGGKAGGTPITIQPKSGAETIMSLTSIQIKVNYGGFTLAPNSGASLWNSISP